jgi:hypothetical protein
MAAGNRNTIALLKLIGAPESVVSRAPEPAATLGLHGSNAVFVTDDKSQAVVIWNNH